MKLVIIGLGVGGFYAAINAKKYAPGADITIIDRKGYDLFSPCGLPFVLEKEVKLEDLKHDMGLESMGMKVIRDTATDILIKVKKVMVGETAVPYDKLILDLGSFPNIPSVLKGLDIHTVSSCEDTARLISSLKKKRKVVIVGGGAIGLETAYALSEGHKIVLIESKMSLLPKSIDPDMSLMIEDYLKGRVRLVLGKEIASADQKSVMVGGERIEYDILISAAGVRPNTQLAEKAGIALGKYGIKTDKAMRTSIKDIYAVGDSAEIKGRITGKEGSMMLATAAYRQGVVAGKNAVGEKDEYPGGMNTFVTKIGALEVASAGFNEESCKDPLPVKARGFTRPEWYPGREEIILKIIYGLKERALLGAQAIGPGAGKKIDLLSLAISERLPLEKLRDIEIAYCPSVSDSYDVVNKAIDLLHRVLKSKDI